jgi:cytoskeleton protein RodZ
MESVGQKLRATRMQLGLTLEQISAKTRISVRNLQALENDDLAPFNSAFFYRSFVRQFAQQLKIEYRDVADAVLQVTSGMPEPLMPGQAELASSGPKVAALRPSHSKKLRWLHSLTSLMLMFLACSGLYDVWENSRSHLQARSAISTPHVPKRTTPTVAAAARIASPSPSDAAVRVELSAIERTWLSVMADGIQTFNGILEADHTKILEGRETARVRTGNAGGLSVVFNGKAIGSLGPRGQIRTVVFTRNGYEMLQSPSSPVAHLLFTEFIPNGE